MNDHAVKAWTRAETTARWVATAVFAVAMAWMALRLLAHTGPDILKGANPDAANAPKDGGQLKDFINAIDQVKGPATVAFGSLSSVGLLAGGAMTGMGMQSGIRTMTFSALAGSGVLLGNGLVA